ncbi:MAG: hypothetical protein ACJA0Q_000045 [Saprospiraceae bacterium]|jgi:hypothetical protein
MKKVFLLIILIIFILSCSKDEENGEVDISVLSSKFNTANTTFTINDEEIVITSKGVPNHESAYYETSNPLYANYTWSAFKKNPNSIAEQNMTMTIPRYPLVASNHESTPLGAMGIAVNSVSLYNQYAAPGDDLEDEIETFDQWAGHPQNQGQYHYHLEASYLSQQNGNEALVGILMDGFPIYGTHENGQQVTNADLDEYHGHTSSTADFPDGIYHYHVTSEDPYMNGNGYYGTAGTLTN